MAWITKNSGTQPIDRRDEPYLDEQLKQQLEAVVARYPKRQAASLPVLHALQEKHGYLPYQAIEEAGNFLETPASVMLDTATFYEEFWLQPHGKYVVWLCQSISCELMGEPSLTERVSEHLGIEPGETTPDGRITLMKVECLGACGNAPVALVDHHLHERLTAENFIRVLDELE